jgi:hypothetical protein
LDNWLKTSIFESIFQRRRKGRQRKKEKKRKKERWRIIVEHNK